MEPPEGHPGNEIIGREVRMTHALQGKDLPEHNFCRPPQGPGIADQQAQVYIHRRMHRGVAKRKISELHRTEFPQLIGQPQIGLHHETENHE